MMFRTVCGVVLAASFLASHASSAEDVAPKDASLDGRWRIVSWEDLGEKAPAASIENFRWTFRGDEAVWSTGRLPGGRSPRELKSKVEIDPSRSPRWITLTPMEGRRRRPTLGIYDFEDGKLKLCFPSVPEGAEAEAEADRPTRFEAGRGSGAMLLILERDADE